MPGHYGKKKGGMKKGGAKKGGAKKGTAKLAAMYGNKKK